MNTYKKYCPNVFVAQCTERHEKGETIILTTKYGKEHECIVFNFIKEINGAFYHSIVRADGFNYQEYVARKAQKLLGYASTAEKKSDEYYKKSNKDRDFLVLGEPVKVGHHSERRHRKAIDDAWNNMGKSVEYSDKAQDYARRAEYWQERENNINLSMPESLDFFKGQLEKAKKEHEDIKSGKTERRHSYSLTYARKKVKDLEDKVKTATILWGDKTK